MKDISTYSIEISKLKEHSIALMGCSESENITLDQINNIYSNVKQDIKLLGNEREQSLIRGGNGIATQFDNGYVLIGCNTQTPTNNKNEFTLYMHLLDLTAKWDSSLLSIYDEDKNNISRLYSSENDKNLLFELKTDFDEKPFVVKMPLNILDKKAWHDIIVKVSKCKLQLIVDGVLIDEEWTLGSAKAIDKGTFIIGGDYDNAQVVSNFNGLIEQLVLWDRNLSNDEIELLCGGREEIKTHTVRYEGQDYPLKQYWRPKGINSNAGDCMPFYYEGRFHLFYLFDRHHHTSKRGLGAHQWAHMSSVDLINWTEHNMAIGIDDEWEGSICTGSVFYYDGLYYAFYAVRMADRSAAKITYAISEDNIHFEKQPFYTTLEFPYDAISARDPIVFKDEQDCLFHMLVTTETKEPTPFARGGCLAHLISTNLKDWEQKEPFIIPDYNDQPECADYFCWNGWYYLIFSNNGVARYRYSEKSLGQWIKPIVDMFDCPQLKVMKTASYEDNRRIGVGFLNDGGYGGKLVFREIIQEVDGTLKTSFVKEMIPTEISKADIKFRNICGEIISKLNCIRISSIQSIGIALVEGNLKEMILSTIVNVEENTACYGFCIGKNEFSNEGYEIRFEPYKQKIGFRNITDNSIEECDSTSIYNLVDLEKSIKVEIILKNGIIDICVGNKRTMVNQINIKEDYKLFMFVQNGSVSFSDVNIKYL